MDIKEIREYKNKIEKIISSRLSEFEVNTGICVDSVELEKVEFCNSKDTRVFSVNIEVKL